MSSSTQTVVTTPATTPIKKGRDASPPRQTRTRIVRRRKTLTDTPATLVQDPTVVLPVTNTTATADPVFTTPPATATRISRREALSANPLAPVRAVIRRNVFEN